MALATSFKLNNGHTMPSIGLGTCRFLFEHFFTRCTSLLIKLSLGQAPPGQVASAVKVAFDCRYRHFDCAAMWVLLLKQGRYLCLIALEKLRKWKGNRWSAKESPGSAQWLLCYEQALEYMSSTGRCWKSLGQDSGWFTTGVPWYDVVDRK